MLKRTELITYFTAFVLFAGAGKAAALEPLQAMGQALYEQSGSNSCSFCHGMDGKKGSVATAANLTLPKSWKSYKALGGDAALAKDPKGFLARMEAAVESLVQNGAIRHNANYKDAAFNWKAISSFNSQMMGLGGAASQSWLKRMADRGVTPEIAAKSLWLYLKKLDSHGVLSK